MRSGVSELIVEFGIHLGLNAIENFYRLVQRCRRSHTDGAFERWQCAFHFEEPRLGLLETPIDPLTYKGQRRKFRCRGKLLHRDCQLFAQRIESLRKVSHFVSLTDGDRRFPCAPAHPIDVLPQQAYRVRYEPRPNDIEEDDERKGSHPSIQEPQACEFYEQ